MGNLRALERLTVKERLQVTGIAGGFLGIFTFFIVFFSVTTAGDSPFAGLRSEFASREWKSAATYVGLAVGYLAATLFCFVAFVQGMFGKQTALTGWVLDRLAELPAPRQDLFPHGFPHLATIRDSIRALYQHLSSRTVRGFPASLPPDLAILGHDEIPEIEVQRLTSRIARHLGLPSGTIVVTFDPGLPPEIPARVELSDRDEYFVDLQPRFRHEGHQDVAAILAHELTHIYLHRAGLWWPSTAENEILTEVTAQYLGVGWLILNSYRRTQKTSFSGLSWRFREERLGYLTPEEFGYVLARRSLAFDETPYRLLTSPAALSAFRTGVRRALSEFKTPPLDASGIVRRAVYRRRRRQIMRMAGRPGAEETRRQYRGYCFEAGETTRVVFDCPVCGQKLRLPVGRGRLLARCGLCESTLDCDT